MGRFLLYRFGVETTSYVREERWLNCAGLVGPARWFIHGSVGTIPVTLSYFILAVPVRWCLGRYSCISSTFPVDIHTLYFLRQWDCRCTVCVRGDKLEIVKHY